ncbi:MAG: hypothetical protein AB7H88_08165 [Vicinamibacterales bacterium]
MSDARVVAHYRSWLRARGLDARIARLRQQPTTAEVEDFGATLVSDPRGDVEALNALTRDELRLSFDWLPVLLLVAYRTQAYKEARGDAEHTAVALGIRTALPQGRRARHQGEDIARNVAWYYRTKVQCPTESVRAIALEYATASGRANDARSVIQNGIGQAAALLDLVVADIHDE